MNIAGRLARHLTMTHWQVRRSFPESALGAIEAAVRAAEQGHTGEIRVVIEGALPAAALWRGITGHQRAIEVFSLLRVWDTEHNNGVLIYLLLADHDVEIVADRGIAHRVGQETWEAICRQMETEFRAGRFREGVLTGIQAVSATLAQHFPGKGKGRGNELPDRPLVL
jgi:uncharacterized membrane protein